MERKVFTHLNGTDAAALNEALSRVGFRRSQSVAYRPACDRCHACISVRIVATQFQMTRSLRRTLNRNRDITATICSSGVTQEQYSLLNKYLVARHKFGGMTDMTYADYGEMVENSPVPTILIEYRLPAKDGETVGRLIAAALTDIMSDGLSMVYSFYDPEDKRRSLGTYMILDHVQRTTALDLRNLYLGYWIKDSPKMAYKRQFSPLERLSAEGWNLMPASDDPAVK